MVPPEMAPMPKSEARAILARTRAGLAVEYREYAANAIRERVTRLPELQTSTQVHCYLAPEGEPEVQTKELLAALGQMGHELFLPVVVGRSRTPGKAPRILEARYRPGDSLIRSPFGIDEPDPKGGRRLASHVAIIPGLGVALNAVRVGHGWGYYDELLADTTTTIIQLCYDACVIGPVIPSDHDVPPSIVITESRILRNRDSRLV